MNICSHKGGFTFIEVMVVLALVVVIGKLALVVSFDTYHSSSYHIDRASLIGMLQHARAEAINNRCEGSGCAGGMPHGVSIQPNRYVLFQGVDYISRDRDADTIIEANPSISHSGMSEIVFATSSGNVQSAGHITISDVSGLVSTITIGNEGQIFWSN